MKVNLEVVSDLQEIEVTVKAPQIDDKVNALMQKLSEETPKLLAGFMDDKVVMIDDDNIVRIFTSNKKVYAVVDSTEYVLKMPLYKVLERLDHSKFVKISNTEIINLKKSVEFDLSYTGTICVKLINGDTSYVSKRFVSTIRKTLGIGG